jgi:hypothetical protein
MAYGTFVHYNTRSVQLRHAIGTYRTLVQYNMTMTIQLHCDVRVEMFTDDPFVLAMSVNSHKTKHTWFNPKAVKGLRVASFALEIPPS